MQLFFVSNALYPIKLMPQILQYLAIFNPLTYAIDAVRSLVITGDLIVLDIAAIAIFDIIMFTVASINSIKIIE
ncbi:ABC-2 type transporter [uncultured archaeon]|nr:ABC-2 type transporter [uncultured archaeon]